jgi:TrmH family RNA methyltransferase
VKLISSKSNHYIKFLRQLRQRKERERSGKFYIEGLRLIGEALRTDFPLESIIFSSDLLTSDFGWKSIEDGKKKGIDIIEVTKDVFQAFALKEGPQGIAAVGFQRWIDINTLRQLEGLWVALDNVQDPGNLGAIMRSLDGTGGKGLILLGNSTDAYHPTSVRSSTGALFSLSIGKTGLREFREWKTKEGVSFVGTVCGEVINYRKYNFPQDMILLMGSEQKGLRKELIEMCEGLVTIPMTGSVDSLNLACAASIVFFEIYAKREKDD